MSKNYNRYGEESKKTDKYGMTDEKNENAKTQKKEILPYPRCDYRADGIWQYFFFRLFPPNESNSNHFPILSN